MINPSVFSMLSFYSEAVVNLNGEDYTVKKEMIQVKRQTKTMHGKVLFYIHIRIWIGPEWETLGHHRVPREDPDFHHKNWTWLSVTWKGMQKERKKYTDQSQNIILLQKKKKKKLILYRKFLFDFHLDFTEMIAPFHRRYRIKHRYSLLG